MEGVNMKIYKRQIRPIIVNYDRNCTASVEGFDFIDESEVDDEKKWLEEIKNNIELDSLDEALIIEERYVEVNVNGRTV